MDAAVGQSLAFFFFGVLILMILGIVVPGLILGRILQGVFVSLIDRISGYRLESWNSYINSVLLCIIPIGPILCSLFMSDYGFVPAQFCLLITLCMYFVWTAFLFNRQPYEGLVWIVMFSLALIMAIFGEVFFVMTTPSPGY